MLRTYHDNSDDNSQQPLLPQPITTSNFEVYKYHAHDEINSIYFPDNSPFPLHTPCRFYLSKGNDGRKKHLSPYTVQILLDNNSKRVKVQYPKGSTYNIRRVNLIPILTKKNIVIVVPETVDYRRLCIVHTTSQDGFIEIGSDLGHTVSRVAAQKTLGIDKSSTSIDIARKNYPDMDFILMDVLTESKECWENIRMDSFSLKDNDQLVVGLDINGNRELEAVRECTRRVLEWWKPRLVLVKSRSLFQALKSQQQEKVDR